MREYLKFYINGEWVDAASGQSLEVENPSTEAVAGVIGRGNAEDVDKAVRGS